MKKLFISAFAVIMLFATSDAQTWVQMMKDPNANFYETVQEFENYWAGKTIEKGKGYKQFRRWQEFMTPRVYPKGDVKQASRAYEEFQKYISTIPFEDLKDRAANWVPLGPNLSVGGGAGRTNFIRFDPTNTNIVYTGSPGGGLWKTTNSGTSWTTNTDQLSVIGCTDVAIDPTNTNIMYLATGDGDAGDTYSIGVLKSTDGGATWVASGLSWVVSQGRTISKLLINPSNTQIVLAATSNGIYRTANGGTTWTQVQTGNFKDMEYKPGDPNTVYASGTTFWLSTNGGTSFTQITSGVPSGPGRIAIAVTPANATYVYLLAANNTDSGFMGVYRSTNSGTTFSTRSTTPNILGWDNGGDAGGQGWYDLAIAVSPTNADDVYTGGVNIWRSTNGGTTWTLNSHWYGGFSKPYVHADIHDLVFLPGSGTTVWSANDGGVFRTTNSGTAYTDLSGSLQIAQQYKIGLSTSSATIIVAGHQDNGTNKLNGATWSEIYGGDGTQCFIDRTNNNNIYASYVYGDFQRSTNGGASWTNIVTGLTGTSGWVTPWHQDPTTATTLWAGYTNMFRSTNSGTSWTQMGTITGTGTIVEFDIAPSNNAILYVARSGSLWKTTNTGTSWTNITSTLPVGSAAITNVEISPTDPNRVYVTFSGYSSGNKVFLTTNGGTTWTNYSTGLPNLPANCIVYQTGSADGVYVGTDVGVYYRDNTLSTWQPYLTGLPNVVVKDLEIYYATGKIRAGTYGRSTWESDLYSPGTSAPVADFSADRTTICAGQTVNFTDLSTYAPTSWAWTFTGGTPGSSTLQNPSVVYNTPGTYAVTLIATNANGSDTETKTAYITVTTPMSLPLVEGFEAATFAPTNWSIRDVNANALTWERNGTEGGFGTSAASAWFNNYNYDEAGARDLLATPIYDFSGVSSPITMTFDVAYARYNATYSDTLSVLISTDCGSTFTQVFIKGGNTLSTNGSVDVTAAVFAPTNAQWRTETVNLNTYAGQPDVQVFFRNHGRYGQAIYLDNVNITGTMGSLPVANFTGTPTTICAGSTVAFTNTSTGATSYAWTFTGGTPGTSTATNPTVTYNTPGTYAVTLIATNASGSDTETKTAYITVVGAPTTSNAGPDQNVCVGSTATMAANTPTTGTGTWTQVSGPASTITTPGSSTTTITGLSTAGTYVYQWTIANAPCTASSDQISIVVTAAPTVANAGSDQTICSGSTVTMAGNTATTGSGTWTKVSGPAGGTITTPGSPTTTITGLTNPGTYVYQWTIANAPCTASSDQMSIIVNAVPTTSNAGTDQTICAGSTLTLAGNSPTSGTGVWSQVSGPASTITSPGSNNSTVTGLTAAGTYVYQWTISNSPCTASSDMVSITVNAAPTTANAGIDQTVCSGSTATMAGNTATVGAGTWTKISGPAGGTITTPGSPTTTITALTNPGTYVYQWTIANAPCTASSDQMSIVVNAAPTTAAAGPDQNVCSGTTVTMAGNTPSSGAGTWTQVSGPASTITTPGSPTSTITGLSAVGTYVYQWTITNAPCTASSDQITITVTTGPTTSNAGPDQNICSGSTATMAGNTPSVGTGTWTKISGPAGGTITTPSSPTTTITGLTNPGTYVYQWSIASAPCPASTDQMSIVVVAAPSTSNAGTDQTICSGSTLTLAGNNPTSGTGMWSQVSGPSSTITTPSANNSTVTGLTVAGTYVYQWSISNSPCTASTDQVSITVNTAPTSANAGIDQTICSGSTATMAGNTATVGTGTWTKISGPAGGTITTPSSPTTTITALTTPGTYVYQWTITNAPCTASSDQMSIVVNAAPTVANAGVDNSYCSSVGTITMAGNTPTVGTGTWTQVSGPASSITTPSSPTTTITGLSTVGTYVYQWTITNAPCTASSDQVTITVTPGPSTSNAGPDQSICLGSTVTMAGNVPTSGTGVWSQISGPSSTITTPSSATTTVTGLSAAGTYVYQWTISGAPCPASTDQVTIVVSASPTTAAAGPDQNICGSSATMAGNTATVGTGLWTLVSGPVTPSITSPSSGTTGITGMTSTGTYIFQWTITNAPCTASSDQVTIIVTAGPTTAAAGPDQNVCGSTATLAGNTPTVGTGTWTFISGPSTPSITTPSSPSSGVSGMSVSGTYIFQWTISSGGSCTPSSDQVSIVISVPPTTSNAGPDQQLCSGGGSLSLAGNTPTVGTGMWTFISGPATPNIVSPTNPTSNVTGTGTAGTYVFQWTITNGSCPSSTDQMSFTRFATPTASNAGPNQNTCGTTATLAGNTPTVGTGTWTFISGPATPSITTPTSPNSGVTGMSSIGTYVFQWTITNGPCTASTDQISITTTTGPTTSNAGPDQDLCIGGGALTLAGNTPTVGTGTWTFISGPATPTITTPTSPTSGVTGTGTAGTYVFQWTISSAGCTSSTDQMSFTRYATPSTSNAGTDQAICASNTNLAATSPTVGTGTWTFISGPTSAIITSPSSITSSVTGMSMSGTYVFQWTVTNGPCAASSDQVSVTVNTVPTVDAGTDVSICEGDTVTLNGSGTGSISWSPSTGLSSTTIANPDANPGSTITYVLTVDNGSCSASDSVTVTVNTAPPVPTITISSDTLYASPSSGFTYQWYFNGSPISGATNPFHVFTANGDYTVEISDGTCSTSSTSMTVTTTLINMLSSNSDILLYPNPNDGNFTIAVKGELKPRCLVILFNSIGEVIYSSEVTFNANTKTADIRLNGIAKGAYNLTISDGKSKFSQKVIIH